MALSKTVTKVFPDANHVVFHLQLVDNTRDPSEQTVIDKDYRHQWASGTSVQNEVKQAIGAEMQKDINAYKALATRFNHEDYGTAASQIDAGLNL